MDSLHETLPYAVAVRMLNEPDRAVLLLLVKPEEIL
jgi:hypothetical protein